MPPERERLILSVEFDGYSRYMSRVAKMFREAVDSIPPRIAGLEIQGYGEQIPQESERQQPRGKSADGPKDSQPKGAGAGKTGVQSTKSPVRPAKKPKRRKPAGSNPSPK